MATGGGCLAARFYSGGINEVRVLLQRAMARGRAQRGFTNDELDAICMFGRGGLPRSEEFETDWNLISRKVFCRASFPLGLTADGALEAETHITGDKIPAIVEEMKRAKEGAVFACGGDGKPIPLEDQAKIYAVLKILEELG
jgi:hypothetical protein